MKDNQQLMIKLSKIIERHPEIYDQNLEAYKTRQVDTAWEKIANSVRMELKEECSVEELKIKWKGIRSSFNRYKNKLLNPTEANLCRKYYLYDTLKFLDPFTNPKGPQRLKDSSLYDECKECIYDEESKASNGNNSSDSWDVSEIKPDITDKVLNPDPVVNQRLSTASEYTSNCETVKKRKHSNEDKILDDDNEDLQFFKSILPDIRDFTNKEKRKLKMGILRLIDDLENERKHQ